MVSTSLRLAPDAPFIYNADGTLNWMQNSSGISTWNNPFSALLHKYRSRTNNLVSDLTLGYQLLPGLEIKGNFGVTRMNTSEFSGQPLSYFRPEDRPFSSRFATYSNSTTNSWIIEPQISYTKNWGATKFDILAGGTAQEKNDEGLYSVGVGFNSDMVMEDISAASVTAIGTSLISKYHYNALFGRLTYRIKDKYIFNFSARRDGSSRFGEKNRFQTFASLGGAWIFSDENFVKKNLTFLSFGKLHGSYGTTGNDQIGDYAYLDLYTSRSYGIPYQNITSFNPRGIANPYLQWEQTKKLQFGIDFGFLKDRILIKSTYAQNRSSNQLVSYSLPSMAGFLSTKANFPATVQNKQWELEINTVNVLHKTIKWTSSGNITIAQNKLIAFPGLENSTYASQYIIGQPLSLVKAYEFLGVDPTLGVYKFADAKGGTTTRPDTAFNQTRTKLINLDPSLYAGLQNSFQYRGFSLDFLFQFVQQIVRNPFRFSNGLDIPGIINQNQPVFLQERWQKPGDLTAFQRFNSNQTVSTEYSNALISDAMYENASYIRLKNISVAWQMPEKWIKHLRLSNVSLYLHAQNVATITNYKGLDPETGSLMPPLRTYVFGLKIGL
jgi:TonB-linked SusC/RagA family outer membrane protein